VNTSQVNVPGGTLYYQARGSGPALILSCGGPGNADTLAPLAGTLQDTRAVIDTVYGYTPPAGCSRTR
jgi:hypothetical protein